jgi:hypothetical protein
VARDIRVVDVSDLPDILRLAEAVQQSGHPRILRCDGEDLAVIFPIAASTRRSRKPRAYSEADDAAFLAAAGGWPDDR